ncbi:MAG: lipoyl(octanoyl) transferase LipB [Ideonella sp.]|nr:lipoyl(octanoyl) transferase LipB [Ideonella sp.]
MQIRVLGRVDYLPTVEAMRRFTELRGPDSPDELWLCEHPPVFTQGVAGRAQHVLDAGDIPVVATDRGGQVTYHGPGQVVAYPLVDLRRHGIYVKEHVFRLEQAAVRVLAAWGVTAHRVSGAPGLYVRLDDPSGHARLDPRPPAEQPTAARLQAGGVDPFRGLGKIAALGVKVTRHCAYHGLALNVAMDLSPFGRIDPCGYRGLRTIDLSTIGVRAAWSDVADRLGRELAALFQPR